MKRTISLLIAVVVGVTVSMPAWSQAPTPAQKDQREDRREARKDRREDRREAKKDKREDQKEARKDRREDRKENKNK